MSIVTKDLSFRTFCILVVYNNSTLSYRLINKNQYNSNAGNHFGVETYQDML